ncbi:uncharacterized protein [Pempheris klunzingeri]|uniref:uncharacterized protein n=1 Tax=Pempheris klunzingeri TaxID=3127111 RepID=UPI00397F1F6F
MVMFSGESFSRITSCSASWRGFNDNPEVDPRLYNLNWMKSIPDDTPVSAISIPGTHESLSLYGGPLATCQVWNLEKQLKMGLRYFDLHAGIWLPNQKHIYIRDSHWMFWQHTDFGEVLKIIFSFLKDHGSETGCLGVLCVNFPSADLIKNIIQLKPCNCGEAPVSESLTSGKDAKLSSESAPKPQSPSSGQDSELTPEPSPDSEPPSEPTPVPAPVPESLTSGKDAKLSSESAPKPEPLTSEQDSESTPESASASESPKSEKDFGPTAEPWPATESPTSGTYTRITSIWAGFRTDI